MPRGNGNLGRKCCQRRRSVQVPELAFRSDYGMEAYALGCGCDLCGFRLASFYDNGIGRAARCGLPSQGDGRSLRVWYHGRQRS